ncbi:MAG: hypothetical protein ACLFTK_14855, partial [Anaerolineales bacterium]
SPAPTLTLAAVLGRFDESPFTTTDYRPELMEFDPDTGTTQTALALWGANAPAYPNRITNLAWGPEGTRLALTALERNDRATLYVYDVPSGNMQPIIPAAAAWTALSRPAWSRAGDWLLLAGRSAAHPGGQILRVDPADGTAEEIAPGWAPDFFGTDARLVYWHAGEVIEHDIISDETRILATDVDAVAALAADPAGERIAFSHAGGLFVWDGAEPRSLYATPSPARLDALVWSTAGILIVENRPPGETEAGYSRVLRLQPADDSPRIDIMVERRYDPLPDDPRQFTAVAPQPRGAFVPPREDGNTL